ncbi:metal-dependent hydrolase [Pseudoxanthomonas helianthi]|uniref:Metal-dependent hydrolase n=1 Tax=Pseudoxanthomonas helianthi TaxID=1453541 RepID=A0A940X2E9_9GAMM|nr:metal-dependent hydrolase [Pseudoxanthomonas helianthi]MBP3984485.1 metal-dependent hydrolase [Pseudoxanthomonas helianthi]
MPTILTHAAVPLAMYVASESGRVSSRLLAAGVVAAMLPDADVVAFAMHIPYADAFGHRGASHSLLFALLIAGLGAGVAKPLRSSPLQAMTWLFVCTASHPLLDAMTSGGLGVALAWPWNDARWFAPWRPIRVSPIGVGFLSARGMETLLSELRWVWLPLFVGAGMWKLINRKPGHPPPR